MTFAHIDTDDGRRLLDADTIAWQFKVAKRSVRRHLQPTACHIATRTNLYDLDTAHDTLSQLKPRGPRRSQI